MSTASACWPVWLAFVASLALQAIVVLYYFAIAHALRIALPLSACFLMVPLCTLLQAVPVSFNGWGLREGSSRSTSADRPLARQRPGLQPGRRRPHRAPVAVGGGRVGLAHARRRPTPRPR